MYMMHIQLLRAAGGTVCKWGGIVYVKGTRFKVPGVDCQVELTHFFVEN